MTRNTTEQNGAPRAEAPKDLYTVAVKRAKPLWRGGRQWSGTARNVDKSLFTDGQWKAMCAEPLLQVTRQNARPRKD